jgi:hypothetical protein
MLRQKNDLAYMVRVMRDLAVDGLHHRMRFVADGYGPAKVRVGEWQQRIEHILPAAFPHFDQFRARLRRSFKFGVAVAVRLLAVRVQKIRPSRAHISRNMFHDDGDGIGFGVERLEQCFVRALCHGPLRETLVIAKKIDGVFHVGCGELVCHAAIFFRFRELSSRAASSRVKQEVTNLGVRDSEQGRVRGWSKKVLDNSLFVRLISLRPNLDYRKGENHDHWTNDAW